MNYYLMHKDIPVALLQIYENAAYIEDYKVLEKELMPLCIENVVSFNQWWKDRCISSDRSDLKEILQKNNVLFREVFLLKNLALNLSDCYWVKPTSMDVSFKDVNLYENDFDNLNIERLDTSTMQFNPNSSTIGQMTKYWHIKNGKRILTKTPGDKLYAIRQCINEEFGTFLHKSLNVFKAVKYTLNYEKQKVVGVSCPTFTSIDVEFVPLCQIIRHGLLYGGDIGKIKKHIYDTIENFGIDREISLKFFSYLHLTDFLISNTDRHLNNYGLLRDTNTLKYIGFAPIFDCGNSFLYNRARNEYYSSNFHDLKTPCAGLLNTSYKLIENGKKYIPYLDFTALPKDEEVYNFYEKRLSLYFSLDSEIIAKAYSYKRQIIERLRENSSIYDILKQRHLIKVWEKSNNDIPPLCL